MYWPALIIIISPLIGSLLLLFKPFKTKISTSIIGSISIAISMFLSLFFLITFLDNPEPVNTFTVYTWLESSRYTFELGIMIDSLSVFMSFVVTVISFFVHIYSIGYMDKDESYNRFFIYTNFFTFSMLIIVFSNNFLQLFIGWELVGLSSYLLIGFWHKKESAIKANLKAFIVNRVGDIGLILGVCLVFVSSQSLDYVNFFNSLSYLSSKSVNIFNSNFQVLPLIALLLFVGAAAKSAQIPLHFWLPDSMEGPTPISALIHAATMVTAGIFMVARLSPLYDQSFYVLDIILVIGCFTAFSMGLVALVQNDIKRIIAYSTISQLGYMTAALGASYYSFAIFHLMTHAFFKALLFLCAGSIILKCHHEQDISKMGGLRKVMPITFITFTIAGLSLIGLPMTSGFFSKDIIIEMFNYEGHTGLYYMLVLGIFFTTLYTSKIFFKVFFGPNKLDIKKPEEHEREHEDVIIYPLIILAVPSAFIGWLLFDPILFSGFFASSITDAMRIETFYFKYILSPINFIGHSFFTLSFLMLLLGAIFSYLLYVKNITLSKKIENSLKPISNILLNEYGFSYLSNILIPKYSRKFANILWLKSDIKVIDNFFINGTAKIILLISSTVRVIQSGYLYHYAFTMILGLVLFLFLFYDF